MSVQKCGHDEKYKDFLRCKSGCLICDLEHYIGENDNLKAEIDGLREVITSLQDELSGEHAGDYD